VSSLVCSAGLFIGQEAGGEGVQWVVGARCAGDVHGRSRARRPWGRAGGAWSRRRGTVGRRWRGHDGRRRAERRGTEKGGPGGSCLLLPCRTAWVGAEGAGLDSGGLLEHGYRIKTNVNSDAHSSSDFLDFCPPGVRHNARKNLNFEILKTATVVCQDTSQGFQNYFCSEEITCFAKICI
jgi:hypothetical protein